MKIPGIYLTSTLACALLAAVVLCLGCEQEGPAEQAGKQLDNAAANVGEKLEEAGDKLKDAARREP